MTQPHWTREAPEKPGHYFIRKAVDTGVKRVSVAEFLDDDDIWLPGVSKSVSTDELREWEWWPTAIETPPKS